jgi:very-short-patch-repair endonuclease
MRKVLTKHEARLWFQLKAFNKELGCHFRRQAVAGPFILDFVDFGRKLIIEVDGWQHGEERREARDRRRDAYFAAVGFVTLRFWNGDIDQNMDGVCDAIVAAVRDRKSVYGSSPSGRWRGRLPREGGGEPFPVPDRSRLDLGDGLARHDRILVLGHELGDASGDVRFDLVERFHHLDEADHIADRDPIAHGLIGRLVGTRSAVEGAGQRRQNAFGCHLKSPVFHAASR